MWARALSIGASFVRGVVRRTMGMALGYHNDNRGARMPMTEAVAILEGRRGFDHTTRFGEAPLAGGRIRLAFDACMRGEFDVYARESAAALQESQAPGQTSTRLYVQGWTSVLAALRRDS